MNGEIATESAVFCELVMARLVRGTARGTVLR